MDGILPVIPRRRSSGHSPAPFCLRNASAAVRSGIPALPPRFRHLSAAAALAKPQTVFRVRPGQPARQKRPVKRIPRSRRIHRRISNAGKCSTRPSLTYQQPRLPAVEANTLGPSFAITASASSTLSLPVRRRGYFSLAIRISAREASSQFFRCPPAWNRRPGIR